MEATGIYHERLAVTLKQQGVRLSIVLPNKIKHFALSLNLKSKTDRIDAATIMRYGLERPLQLWDPPSELLQQLKALTREHSDTQTLLTEIKNRLHAAERAVSTPKRLLKRLRQTRDLLKKQLQQIEKELAEAATADDSIAESVACLESIPGVGLLTAVGIIAETGNFALFEQAGQLVSYSGLDPQLRQSGRYTGRTMISAKGNAHIRRMLYMPALTAIRHNEALRGVYQRLVSTKGKKMIAVTAIMRKLLVLMFTLAKKRQRFDPAYHLAGAAMA
jgi:transposase